jgi:hydroxymethylpyrimidine/phosphomethylpyrimidine kinase
VNPPVVLTIAGSDSGGGAGIQADVRTFALLGAFGTTAITAITAQNTVDVVRVHTLDVDVVRAQIDAVLVDMPVVAVKTGMLATAEIVELVASYELPNLVVDPVVISSSGRRLLEPSAIDAYKNALLPRCRVMSPNAAEATMLTGVEIHGVDDMVRAGRALQDLGPRTVVVTGSELGVDVVVDDDELHTLIADVVQTRNTHGTGCVFSAAITAELGQGSSALRAIATAKRFTHGALSASKALHFGEGRGPAMMAITVAERVTSLRVRTLLV